MEKIMLGYLVGVGTIADMWDDHGYDFTDAGMSEIVAKDNLNVAECDKFVRNCLERLLLCAI